MTLGQLERSEEGQSTIAALLELRRNIRHEFWDTARVWKFPAPYIEHRADGLRKAGLEIEAMPGSSPGAG